jgi:hypothetical protein
MKPDYKAHFAHSISHHEKMAAHHSRLSDLHKSLSDEHSSRAVHYRELAGDGGIESMLFPGSGESAFSSTKAGGTDEFLKYLCE